LNVDSHLHSVVCLTARKRVGVKKVRKSPAAKCFGFMVLLFGGAAGHAEQQHVYSAPTPNKSSRSAHAHTRICNMD
jgi:hypothetical protein